VIIVTGASKGLGRVICERIVSGGGSVLGLARDVEGLPFDSRKCDVSSYEEIRSISQQLRRDRVKVSGLVNAAGVASMNLALTTPPAVAQRLIGVNLLGTIYCCQLFAPLMIRGRYGSIVNFSTIAVALGLKGESVYVASKAGVEGFSRSFAREMADFNIRVNCIAPGPIDTALLRGVTSEQISRIVEDQIIAKQFPASSVADLVELLFDARSESITGQVLHVGGV
jgi:3-oxoacyl-[acyl-carrier protein] reductase